MTKFNNKFPRATNIELGSNGKVWGIRFNLPNDSKRKFYPIETDPNGIIESESEIISLTKIPPFLKEEDMKICLN